MFEALLGWQSPGRRNVVVAHLAQVSCDFRTSGLPPGAMCSAPSQLFFPTPTKNALAFCGSDPFCVLSYVRLKAKLIKSVCRAVLRRKGRFLEAETVVDSRTINRGTRKDQVVLTPE